MILIFISASILFSILLYTFINVIIQADNIKEGYQQKLIFKRNELFVLKTNLKPVRIKNYAYKLASEFIEKNILFKTDNFGYWNNVNMNLRLVGCFLASLQIAITILIINFLFTNGTSLININEFLTIFGAIFVAFFFNDKTSYYQKWSYLANLYNERIKSIPEEYCREENTFSYRKMLEISLAIDVIQMEMWSHDSFAEFTRNELFEAIRAREPTLKNKVNLELLTFTNELDKASAINYLVERQKTILESYKQLNKKSVPMKHINKSTVKDKV